jgi:EREBP-like factor
VQAAAAKEAQMVRFDSSSLVSAMDLSKESEELSEIVELPSLGTSYEFGDELPSLVSAMDEFVFVDSVDGWGMSCLNFSFLPFSSFQTQF